MLALAATSTLSAGALTLIDDMRANIRTMMREAAE